VKIIAAYYQFFTRLFPVFALGARKKKQRAATSDNDQQQVLNFVVSRCYFVPL
jgi:hypothetical protein